MLNRDQKRKILKFAIKVCLGDVNLGMCKGIEQGAMDVDCKCPSLMHLGIIKPPDADLGSYWFPRDKVGQYRRVILLQQALITLNDQEPEKSEGPVVSVRDLQGHVMPSDKGRTTNERARDRHFSDWILGRISPTPMDRVFRSDRDLCDYIDQRIREGLSKTTNEVEIRDAAIRVVKAAVDCGSSVPVVTYANSNRVDAAIKELNHVLKTK